LVVSFKGEVTKRACACHDFRGARKSHSRNIFLATFFLKTHERLKFTTQKSK